MTDLCPVCGKGETTWEYGHPVLCSHLDCVRQGEDDRNLYFTKMQDEFKRAEQAEAQLKRADKRWYEAQAELAATRVSRNAARAEALTARDELAALKAAWTRLRRQVMVYEKSGYDLYQRENGKAFRKMMDRVLATREEET